MVESRNLRLVARAAGHGSGRPTGRGWGRPLVDTLRGSKLAHLKELRLESVTRSEIRILFAFDPTRQVILLTAGDKAGRWKQWYGQHTPLAEQRYERWLAGDYDEEEI
ncbi:addiction module toxin RelE [Deinococcus radiopugnans ATCC 19172]|uniref:Addiction module toxin RelE n=1 Tax=Deinococcus radiopugnans ATCC 19172 TaxID=585398 RepID=A0A5C4XZQ8_9DEIO|nr:addiction module toxin RelE [Deinococcus radiopugnans ATCC 19172]